MDKRTEAVLWSSAETEYGTPEYIWQPVVDALSLEYDAAASHENHVLPVYSTMDGTWTKHWSTPSRRGTSEGTKNGLEAAWSLGTWCNPPYGRGITEQWCRKAALEVKSGRCPMAALLLPSRTDTDWYHRWVVPYATVYQLMGRIKFIGAKDSAPFPSIIAVYSPGMSVPQGTVLSRTWDPKSEPEFPL
jgi:DNA N-6-adenine-methyltransferase (Dam)